MSSKPEVLPYNLNYRNAPQVFRSIISRCGTPSNLPSLEFFESSDQARGSWDIVSAALYSLIRSFSQEGSALLFERKFNVAVATSQQYERSSFVKHVDPNSAQAWSDLRKVGSSDLTLLNDVLCHFLSDLESDIANLEESDDVTKAVVFKVRLITKYFEGVESFSGLNSIVLCYKSKTTNQKHKAFDSDDVSTSSTTKPRKLSLSDVGQESLFQGLTIDLGVSALRMAKDAGYINEDSYQKSVNLVKSMFEGRNAN